MKFSLKISQKLWLSSLAFALPITLLLYFMVSGINYNIRFARLESWGNQVLGPLSDLMVLIPRHQLLVMLRRAEESSAARELTSTTEQIEQAFAQLEDLTAQFGRALRIDSEGLRAVQMGHLQPTALRQQWNSLQNALTNLDAKQLAQSYQNLVQNLRALINQVGDTSNLVLDPDLDSYYLMDIAVWLMPDLQNRLGKILVFSQEVFAQSELTDTQRVQFGIEASLLKESLLLPLQQEVDIALRTDQDFYGISPSLQEKLPPALKKFTEVAFKFNARLESLLHDAQEPQTFADIRTLGDGALQTGTEFWKTCRAELGILIARRIAHYQRTRLFYVGASLLALAIACGLVFLISRGITKGIANVVTMTEHIAQGNLAAVAVESFAQDEIGILMKALANLQERIRNVLKGMDGLSQMIQQGKLDVRGQTDEVAGSWRDMVVGMNAVIEAFIMPFTGISKYLDRISKGDLPEKIPEDYQGDFNTFKQNLIRLIQTLQEMVGGIRSGTDVLREAVQHLTVSSQEIASTSNEQAAAVKEIVSTMEDSDRLAKSIARKIQDVTTLTEQTKTLVNDGLKVVHDSLKQMDTIKTANAETIAGINALGDKIVSIWDIVNMINGIADQTKIIAFNAELEASTAGEAGKNFQIVASEIRRLADSTVASTDEIKTQITTIQQTSDRLTMTAEQDATKIMAGWELSRSLQNLFEHIRNSAEASDRSVEQIALSIKQQVSAFEQILLTIKQIAEGIENFSVSTKATTGAAEHLREMAEQLHTVIGNFHNGG